MNQPRIVSAFVKSSYSGGAVNECVEVAFTSDGGRAVRDSKNPAAPAQLHSPAPWAAFLHAVKDGTLHGN
ncbi:hypothetical protein GCM10009716_21810 [Streptomyces sodiiphilus]|uniref:DUF397 domain-containing protein n=1 Tax=Streptomyces sodiiphilus TaxID=226217 RepID=A0ABN2P7A2_9ACTN